MFSIFTYIMSHVTHSEPGLPMLLEERVSQRQTIMSLCDYPDYH